MKYTKIREEELKNRVGQDFFKDFDTATIVGNIDFTVKPNKPHPSPPQSGGGFDEVSLLWAEAKTGDYNLFAMFAQLIITIGKARTFDKYMPPSFLGVFDCKKIVFIPYSQIVDIFLMNDFNWNVTPSNHETKEFLLIKTRIESILQKETYQFDYIDDENELHFFIKHNLGKATSTAKIHIDKNNFVSIYLRWLVQIKPHISFDWEAGKKLNILDSDFFLADLFVDDKGTVTIEDDTTIKDDLFVVFKSGRYEISKENIKQLYDASIAIKDLNQYEQFWKKYKRPPISIFHDYIIDRRDLLIPQDIRERKGAFFTPQIWVELSQKYLADVLGEDWQEDYYIWDCAAGTGNLLAGLTNKYNIYASTLDQADVNVMQERIKNGAILLKDHCFQFDFLNDDFIPVSQGGKIPDNLFKIINDPEKRKKLVVYINPPYAEASNKKTLKRIEGNKGVEQSQINKKYANHLGQGNAELFVQFLTRIYIEVPDCLISNFSTLKIINGPHFENFRNFYKAKLEKAFICPAETFDNVKGKFPIGFMIWNTTKKETIQKVKIDIYSKVGEKQGAKFFRSYDADKYINEWIKPYRGDIKTNQLIGKFPFKGNDFQNQNMIQIVHHKMDYNTEAGQFLINQKNVMISCIYFAVRKCIAASWINDRDQFLFPNNKWENDLEFQSDCLAYTLFTNNIQSEFGINHWIPFTEVEVDAKTKFDSNFMTQFIAGKINTEVTFDLFSKPETKKQCAIKFSEKAKKVFNTGRELWKYYHSQKEVNVNASLYDIREYFQGRNDKGKMNIKSEDSQYMVLIASLRDSLKILAQKIEPKVYEYGFLMD
ncbi:MAG: hypothetical protein ACOVQ2_03665 [Flavobacterium sp.]